MARISVSTVIDAPPEQVWADLADVASHVEWMADAESIRFRPGPTEGVGTVFDCETRVGPFRLTDTMEITAWTAGATMGVRHVGLVTGSGQFRLDPHQGDRTLFTWDEELEFPLWMGGRVGARVGAVVLRRIWRGNLRRLQARFSST